MLQKNRSQSSRKGNNRLTPHMHPDEATGKLIITPAQHMRPQRPGKRAESRRWAQGVKDNPPHGVPSVGLMQDRDPRAAGRQVDESTPDLQALVAPSPPHLSPVLLGAAAAIGRAEAETLGAALGVGGIQRKCPQATLVTPQALHILLKDKQSSMASAASHKASVEDRDGCLSDQSTMLWCWKMLNQSPKQVCLYSTHQTLNSPTENTCKP